MHKYLITYYLLCFCTLVSAQYWFKPLKSNIGTNMVESMYRDHDGYLWIGNQRSGLMRYDGYILETFLHQDNDTTTISSDEIKCIIEDSENVLWVGTKNGLNKYDREKKQFTHYYFKNYPNAFYIEEIKESPKKELYILTQNGIFIYNRSKNNFNRFSISENKTDNYFTCIDWDKDNQTWCATINHNGLYLLNEDNNKFSFFKDDAGNSNSPGIKTLLIDSDNKFWYGHRGVGFASFSPQTQNFTYFPSSNNGLGLNGNFITSIIEKDSNTILIGIDQGGINILDKTTNKFSYINDNDPTFGELTSNGIYSIYKDAEDILWVGTSRGGLCYSNLKERRFVSYQAKHYKIMQEYSYFPSYGFNSTFQEDSYGKIWIGTDGGGVMTFDTKTQLFRKVFELEKIPDTKSINIIRSIQEDDQKNIWIATWLGDIIKYNIQQNSYKKITLPAPKDLNPFASEIWNLHIDKKERIWIANPFGSISIYNKSIELLNTFFIGDSIFSSKDPLILESPNNNIYISQRNGIYRFDEKSSKINKIIDTKGITYLDFATEKDLWIANDKGFLLHYNSNGNLLDKVEIHATNEKVQIKAIACYNNQIWISTSSGLIKYDIITKEQTVFNEDDGLQGNHFFIQSALKTKDGALYFGGSRGFTTFYPDKIKPNEIIPPVFITDIIVSYNHNTTDKDSSEIRKNTFNQDTIILPWNKKQSLEFKFAGINFTNSSKNKFKYKLEGFENQWNNTDAFSRKATYTNLNPGNYTFYVMACNNDGIWNDKGKKITLIITPPFRKTTLFYIGLIIISILIIQSIIKYRERKIKQNSERLKEIVAKRTAVIENQKETLNYQNKLLEEKNSELANKQEKLQRQNKELDMHRQNLEKMVSSRTADLLKAKEKAEESEKLKSSFLANMSHEIRTPMNAIVGFSCLLKDSELTDEEKNSFISTITTNADVLLNLVEDILDFSLIESNQMNIRKKEFGLNPFMESIFNSFIVNLHNKNVKLIMNNTLYEKNIHLNSDEYRIRQIIVNLIGNAIKFTQKGSVELGNRLTDDTLEIYVRDTGIGMTDEEQQLIFNQFVKLEKSSMENKRGIGLGLSISKRLATLLEGNLTVKSQKDQGSEFIFSLEINRQTKNRY